VNVNKRAVARPKIERLHPFAIFAGSQQSLAAPKPASGLRAPSFRRRAPPAAPASARYPRSGLAPENQQAAQDSRCSRSSNAPAPERPERVRTISLRTRAGFETWLPTPCSLAARMIVANRPRHAETERSQRSCEAKSDAALAL